MIIKGRCKICHRPLDLECDDDYDLGDPFKLAAMVTCNRCYDQRGRYAVLHREIGTICKSITSTPIAKRHELLLESREPIQILTKKYAEAFQEFNGGPEVVWDDEFPQMILDHPDKWFKILEDYRRGTSKQWAL